MSDATTFPTKQLMIITITAQKLNTTSSHLHNTINLIFHGIICKKYFQLLKFF